MHRRGFWLSGLAFAGVILTASVAHALGFRLAETKEQLKLDYQVEVTDHGTGRVTINVTIADEGRLKPLYAVDLVIPSKDGTNFVDLSVSLATRVVDGKMFATAHLQKEWAERAEIQLNTSAIDGKTLGLTWYYYTIPVAPYLVKSGPPKKG